jgi:hypothetical protein
LKFVREAKVKPPEMKRPAGRNSFMMQSRVYRSRKGVYWRIQTGASRKASPLKRESGCGMLKAGTPDKEAMGEEFRLQ